MNIIRARQDERIAKIKVIESSIRQAKDPDMEKLLMRICSEWGLTKRTAQEYIEVAQFNIDKGINPQQGIGHGWEDQWEKHVDDVDLEVPKK